MTTKYTDENPDSIRIRNVQDENNYKNTEISQNNSKNQTGMVNSFLLTAVISALIYLLSVWLTANSTIVDVVNFEVPLIVAFSLILSYLVMNKHTKPAYIFYVVLGVVIYFINPTITYLLYTTILSQLLVVNIDKLYRSSDNTNHDLKQTKKGYFKQSFKRIKYHLALAGILLFSGVILAYLYPSVFQSLVLPTVQNMQEGGAGQLTVTGLFTNNLSVSLLMIINTLKLSIPTVYLLFYNGIVIGFTGRLIPLESFLLYTVPHGIFELTAVIFAGAISFRFTQAILNFINGFINPKTDYKTEAGITLDMMTDCAIPFVMMIILLLIAAFIEANLTIPIGQTILNM